MDIKDVFLVPPKAENCVYAMTDDTGAICYIGETGNDLPLRLEGHIAAARSSDPKKKWPVIKWLLSMAKSDRHISVLVLGNDYDSNEARKMAEAGWIQYYRDNGCRLLNHNKLLPRTDPDVWHAKGLSMTLWGVRSKWEKEIESIAT